MSSLPQLLASKTKLPLEVINNIISLINEGNTIPFIARYRKEMTGGASDTQLRDFEEVYNYQKKLSERKEDILRLLEEKEVITDELRKAVANAETLSTLEDVYRPFKEKKNTRGTKAIAKGLQPLADMLLNCQISLFAFEQEAENFVKETGDEKTSVTSKEEAIQGAKDIVAEVVADDTKLRVMLKKSQAMRVPLTTKATKTFDEQSVYKTYKDYQKSLSQMPSYAYLAVARAEKEKQLRVKLMFDEESCFSHGARLFIPRGASDLRDVLLEAIQDGIKRLLLSSLERELRAEKREQSDRDAIDVFGKNVEALLLSSPVRGKVIMWFDPAYRTWCKIAVIDETGKFLDKTVVYPTKPQEDIIWASKVLLWLIKKYKIWLICIGNGTGSRESESFVSELISTHGLDCKYLVVSEAGASVYSASKLANEEYPELDVTIRGAINIAQRVQDPLATYVKIDPKSLGVGQYQHDVDQKLLKEKLEHHIEDAVNRVGVDVNTASWALLQHIAWLSTKTAQHIVSMRESEGPFEKRSQIKKVKGLGAKAFEQCAGFLRIVEGKEILDRTGIHPESYKVTYEILEKEFWIAKKNLTLPFLADRKIELHTIANRYDIGLETLKDIIAELANPWLDPREDFDEKGFKSGVLTLEDLVKGMELQGIVRNITDFGAFVDIGLKNDGLVHKSQLSDTYVSNPFDVVSVGQQISVRVLEVDVERKRVSLSVRNG